MVHLGGNPPSPQIVGFLKIRLLFLYPKLFLVVGFSVDEQSSLFGNIMVEQLLLLHCVGSSGENFLTII